MCGIVVVDNMECEVLDPRDLVDMLVDSADRGQDSTGVTLVLADGGIYSHKVSGSVEKWVETCTTEFWLNYSRARFVLGVNRAQPVPEGDSQDPRNRQPIQWNNWIGVHNGTIGNDRELKEKYDFEPNSQIDTEVAIALLEYEGGRISGVKRWASQLSGGMAIFAVNTKSKSWVCVKNFKPLCYCDYKNVRFWASERKTLERICLENITWVPPYTGFVGLGKEIDQFPIQTLHETTIPEPDFDKALVVASGGIDSSTAAFIAAKMHSKRVRLVHFDYGQAARDREIAAVAEVAEELSCQYMDVDLRWLGVLADTPLITGNRLPLGVKSVETTGCWVPARNLVMLSIAAAICESEGIGCIYSGFNLEESGVYPDNDIEFLKVFNLALNYGTLRRPRLVLTLERLMKPEIIKLGNHLGVPYAKTWSCDRGEEKPCGECGCCWMRQFAFRKAGVFDGQTYLNPPREGVAWDSGPVSEVVSLEDIVNRVKSGGLEDLIG